MIRHTLSSRRPARAGSPPALILAALTLATAGLGASALAAADEVNPAYEPLAWLAGEWQAEFRPHGEKLAAPTMAFTWGDENRSFLTMTGTKPAPGGGLEPEYESKVVWDPVQRKFVFLGVYRAGGGRVTEDGEIEILEDGAVRLHMNVHYPPGASVPFTDGLVAGPEGHTLRFRRTFHRAGDDELRGIFRIQRDDRWEDPHPGMAPEGGFPWRRMSPAADKPAVTAAPDWVREHWGRMVGRWVADNSTYKSDQETADAYGIEWAWGVGRTSLTGRLFALEDGAETATYWQFREFWHPGAGRLTVEQFGAGGAYGVGHAEVGADGAHEMEQVFYYPAAGATARVGHRSGFDGDVHVTESFDIDEAGVWKPRRSYEWRRQPSVDGGKSSP